MIEVIYNKEENLVPIKSWVTELEKSALDQANNLSNFPFIFKHVALMPDCHMGFGMPIGGVIAVKDVVIPNAVGVDIGCGMCSVKIDFPWKDLKKEVLKEIMGEIRKKIPVGFNHNPIACEDKEMPLGSKPTYLPIVYAEWNSAKKQLGSLGGGNHFIEIQKGDDGNLWVMIHSGSRNLGKKVADHYNKLAENLNNKYASIVTKDKELAFLPLDTEEGKKYLEEMEYCLKFAYANRKIMMDKVLNIINDKLFKDKENLVTYTMYNIHHNYASLESHFGELVMVHRKGATKALHGLIGIIPGSQGTCSYIVEGLGNLESFMSCSHGAGRKMGRKDACRILNLEEEKKKLDDKGIVHGIRSVRELDEAAGAYKDIDIVMDNQKDLVKILVKLEPLGVIKG